ncbi:hypothetical protein Bca52824_080064 [Brassica carinata]|uniref:F-box domain-containing protein n=1 Tax=Brassica carinata TaxID=52824 RepID=A0A8X7Q185_BRACI|nr:hypothetical protein Bca52824_080064 [Brassica carinata]
MNSKKMDTGSKDLISNLPDELICHILSFLTTTEAASTSVLSKRWRNLLPFVTSLDFDDSIYDFPEMGIQRKPHFDDFVDKVLALQGNDAPLNGFSLKCSSDPSLVNGWILKVLDRGATDLDLYVSSYEYKYTLPPQVLMSKTLVKLRVSEFTIDVGEVSLPKLKTLHMNNVAFADESGAAFAKLVSSCHVLEELVLDKMTWDFWDSCSVSNPCLKRVTIYSENVDDENPNSVSFDAPNLVSLVFSDIVAVKYPKVSFDSLVEASVGVRMRPDQVFYARDLVHQRYGYKLSEVGDATVFLMGISNVKKLYLSSQALEVLTFCCKAIPVFNNLMHLTIETDQEVDWESTPNLLKNCPNLETLVFEGLHYGDTNQCEDDRYRFNETNICWDDDEDRCVCKPWEGTPIWLSSSPVKKLKVLKFGEISSNIDDMDKQMDLINYFVETMPNLEEVVLYCVTPFDGYVEIVSKGFQKLEKVASTKCKIRVISDEISFSSTVYSTSPRAGLVFFKNSFPV